MTVKSNTQQTELSGFVLERTAKRMKQSFKQELKRAGVGVTVDQWVVLYELSKEDGLGQYEIGERVFKDAPTLTRIIDLLGKKELIKREPDPEDRRKFSINLTLAGRQKVKEILPVAQQFRQRAWKGMSPREIQDITEALNTIFNNLT